MADGKAVGMVGIRQVGRGKGPPAALRGFTGKTIKSGALWRYSAYGWVTSCRKGSIAAVKKATPFQKDVVAFSGCRQRENFCRGRQAIPPDCHYKLNSDSKLSSASRRWALRMQQQMLVSDVVTMSGDTWADDNAA